MTPEELASEEDFWFLVQQAFTEDRNIINLNCGTIQPGLRVVQDASLSAKEVDVFAEVMEGLVKKGLPA
jgi:hypothetical protein